MLCFLNKIFKKRKKHKKKFCKENKKEICKKNNEILKKTKKETLNEKEEILNEKEILKKTKKEIRKENNSKENFCKIIRQILLEYSEKLIDSNQHIRLINIAYDIIINNIDSDDWYFKKYLEIFFFYQEDEIYSLYNPYYNNYRTPYELFKIKQLLRKYKLSEIIELFLNKIQIFPKYTKDKTEYYEMNKQLLRNIHGLTFLLKYLIKDIEIPKKFELCTTAIEQMLYIARYRMILSISYSYAKFTQF